MNKDVETIYYRMFFKPTKWDSGVSFGPKIPGMPSAGMVFFTPQIAARSVLDKIIYESKNFRPIWIL